MNRKKGKKKVSNLLSFMDDEDDDYIPLVAKNKAKKAKGDSVQKKLKKKKILSPFDLLKDDKTLSKEAGLSKEEIAKLEQAKKERLEKERIKNQIKNANGLLGKRETSETSGDGKLNPNKSKMREDMKQLLNNEVEGMKVKKNSKTGRYEIAFNNNSSESDSSDSDSSSSGSSLDPEE